MSNYIKQFLGLSEVSEGDVLIFHNGFWVNSAATFGTGGSGSNGTSGTNGTSGSSGTSGTSGSSGSSGINGTSGTDGTSGTNGTSGSSGTSGVSVDLYVDTDLKESTIDKLNFITGSGVTVIYNGDGAVEINAINNVDLYVNDVLKEQKISSIKLIDGAKMSVTYTIDGKIQFSVDATQTQYSIIGDGTSGNTIRLIGDVENPGTMKYYGTDVVGVKGFHAVVSSSVEAFTDLSDVIPEDYVGKKNHIPIVVETEDALDLIDTEELLTELAKFTLLADVPSNYSGMAGYYVRVKLDESGLEFYMP